MKFIIYGNPIPKKRARHARRGNFVVTYDEQDEVKKNVTRQFEMMFQQKINSEIKEIVIEASKLAQAVNFSLDVSFYLPVPVSESYTSRNAKLWGLEPHNKKPDLSNMLKFYEDAANNVLFPDDSMITICTMTKKYSKNPRTEIEIMPNKELNLSDDAKSVLKIFSPDDLQEFIEDAKKITCMDLQGMEEASTDIKSEWLHSATSILTKFSQKYADKIKKISKYNVEQKTNLCQKKTHLLF
jgi:Holliday junction resolvase RusA-like endonuclease